ncbi:MAG: hypothetical protein FJY92_01935 [Candidatus Hydrogenedentes bacterium]|nr:hypothetical protein [Candidatus Hydrogenedentota bacterium]
MAGAWARIGNVRSVNPARRELRIDAAKTVEENVRRAPRVRVVPSGGAPIVCAVDAVDANAGGLIVTLGAGVSRDTVARMKHAAIEIERARRKTSATAEMDAADWIGLDVVGADGARIGVIRGCIESAAHDILEMETPEGSEVLVPAIEQTVESIDLEAGRVVVRDIAPYAVRHAD